MSLTRQAELLRAAWETTWARARQGPMRPSWSWRFEIAMRLQRRDSARAAALPLLEQRARFEAEVPELPPLLHQVRRMEATVGGVPGTFFEPREGEAPREILYFHGGAFFEGSSRTHADLIMRLALAARARVFAPDYRLAPEHPYPAALDDGVAVWEGLVAAGTDPERLVVAGDSAGANLALGTLLRTRGAAARPAGGLLLSPWIDLAAAGGSVETNAPWDWPAPASFSLAREAWLGPTLDPADPGPSPAHADPAGLPPLRLEVGTAELLHDQVAAFARKAGAAGVRVELVEIPDGVHTTHGFAGRFAWAQRLIEASGAWVRQQVPDQKPLPNAST